MCRTGSSDKTVNPNCERCMTAITPATSTRTAANLSSSSDLESTLFSLRRRGRRYLYGGGSATTAHSGASTAASSATSRRPSVRPTLSERLTPSLIAAGLVCGTTLTFGRRLSRAGIPAGVSYAPDGTALEKPRADLSFWPDAHDEESRATCKRKERDDGNGTFC